MTYRKKFNKYGAKKTTFGGRKYDSKFEARGAQELELRRLAGEIEDVRPQVTLHLFSYGQKLCTYRIDFVVKVKEGQYELIEYKGLELGAFPIKWRALEICKDQADFRIANGFGPMDELEMVMVKQRSGYRPKRSK